MLRPRGKVARAITSFVENPVTNLVKGIALLLIGLTDASHTFGKTSRTGMSASVMA